MVSSNKLVVALSSVDWEDNAAWLSGQPELADRIEACNMLIAVWSKQFEKIEASTPALSFVREMQHSGHHAACCLGLALYKPAAGAMRAMLECALYFCFFRSHFSELQTLVRDDKYYITKKDVTDFFKKHVVDFNKKQEKLNLLLRMDKWYSKTSAIVHGQMPGVWSQGASVTSFVHNDTLIAKAVEHFECGTLLIRDLFLCTVASEIWHGVSTTAKTSLLKNVPADVRAVLKLDAA